MPGALILLAGRRSFCANSGVQIRDLLSTLDCLFCRATGFSHQQSPVQNVQAKTYNPHSVVFNYDDNSLVL
jgi:hypothetical protein